MRANTLSGSQPWAQSPQLRRGFTLIELLVVIGVIALLLSTGLLVMGNVLQNAREKATMATIIKVNGMVQQRTEALQRYLEKSSTKTVERDKTKKFVKLAINRYPAYTPIPQFAADNAQLAEWDVLTLARMSREVLPQSFVDICGPDLVPGTTADDDSAGAVNFLSNKAPDINEFGKGADHGDALAFVKAIDALKSQIDLTKHQPETESAELLYLALTATEAFGVPPVGQDEFSTSEIRDTDGDGLLEFIDAWGHPLRFYRWPTRLLRCGEDAFTMDTNGNSSVDPAGPNACPDPTYANLMIGTLPSLTKECGAVTGGPLSRDPNDGFNRIPLLLKNNAPVAADLPRYRWNYEFWFYTLDTFSTSLIVSAGVDGQLGLYEPSDSDPPTSTAPSTKLGHLAQPKVLGDPSTSPLADNITNRKQ